MSQRGAPLLVAAASLATRLRPDRKKQLALWIIAGLLSLVMLLPLIVIWMGWSSTSYVDHPVLPH